MILRFRRSFVFPMLALIGAAAIACSTAASSTAPSSVSEAETQPNTRVESPSADAQAAPEPTPVAPASLADTSSAVASETGSDPNKSMFELFPGFGISGGKRTRDALDLVLEQRDTSQLAIMVEMIRFLPSMKSREETATVLRELTGESFNGEQWQEWTEWYGKNLDAFPPPEKYLDWKIKLMGQADPGFVRFLRGTEDTARISYTELLWGGVPQSSGRSGRSGTARTWTLFLPLIDTWTGRSS